MAEALKRRIGPGLLMAYGVGVIVGAGIYVLVGAVAGAAGVWAPLSFLLAGLIAAPTALSYAELSVRYPEAAGEAAYVEGGLGSRWLAVVVGLGIVLAGTISAAAVLRGGVGYLTGVVAIDPTWAIAGIGAALVAVSIVGVLESLALAALFTLVELAGLGLVVWAASGAEPVAGYLAAPQIHWAGVGAGAVLAFFAFIGFEDIVNMAEEVRDPGRTLPLAILGALGIATLIYGLVSWSAVRALPADVLTGSEQPLALVWQQTRGGDARVLSMIAVVAALNGVLAQIVMAARVLFGMRTRWALLAPLGHVSARFGTPVAATLLVGAAVIATATALPVATLAESTSAVLLAVFVLVNAALIGLKRRGPSPGFSVPMIVPVAGLGIAAVTFGLTLKGLT
ncbi:APC family permease [Mesobacterium pallidum]|uniref:APC family permease n=1 Tax=Mesobacterium pallidum TaxID=2872037 RepID=UPI001EE2A336|nr:amino acid permease [Mesobacterium pallidum]